MEAITKKHKIIFSLAALGVIILAAMVMNLPPKTVSAIGLCSDVGTPTIRVDINSQTYWGDASITVPAGSVLPFTVWTYAEPSSPNSITYPGGSNTYPGPCGILGCPGRSYTTSAINSPGAIVVNVTQNCSGGIPPEATLTINIGLPAATCAINTFTCDPATATLAWGTSNCSSVSINNGVGVVPPTGNTQGLVGTVYTLTADSKTSTATCPAPTLTTTGGGSRTVTPGTTITLPSFNFDNTGESGSVIHYNNCEKNPPPTGGITADLPDCPPPKDLVAP